MDWTLVTSELESLENTYLTRLHDLRSYYTKYATRTALRNKMGGKPDYEMWIGTDLALNISIGLMMCNKPKAGMHHVLNTWVQGDTSKATIMANEMLKKIVSYLKSKGETSFYFKWTTVSEPTKSVIASSVLEPVLSTYFREIIREPINAEWDKVVCNGLR